ncbi:MAG: biotin synthase BioB [Planctomycetaceae bacterium]
MDAIIPAAHTAGRWNELADRVLDGHVITPAEGLEVLRSSDAEILELLAAAYRVRHQHFGNKVHLYYLKNAKSGLCPEDCGYCSQSKVSDAPIERYAFLNEAKLMEGARQASESNARTYCIVASGRGPTDREVDHVASVVRKIKAEYGLHICACLGLLSSDQADRLARAGVNRINHNLNTSRAFYEQICTTHTFEDRLDTLRVVREAGMELCSGMIVGMGEQDDDVVDLVLQLRELKVESIPINFLHSIDGTPLQKFENLNPRRCLKALCLVRFANPSTEVRIAGGREVQLRSLQPLGLYPANSMFVSDYLTTKGQEASLDFQMVEDLGFEIITHDHMENAVSEAPAR